MYIHSIKSVFMLLFKTLTILQDRSLRHSGCFFRILGNTPLIILMNIK